MRVVYSMIIRALVLTLASVFFQNCRGHEIHKEAPEINEIRTETKFRINLEEDHSRGYTWQLQDSYDRSIVEQLNSVWHGNLKGIDFNFKTHAVGRTILTFVKRRYTDTLDVKTFIVKISR
jgi:hypothetical protein